MNAKVDVLTVMEAALIDLTLARKTEVALHMAEARTAVAELIEAAKGVEEMEDEPRFLYDEIASLRAALARIGADA